MLFLGDLRFDVIGKDPDQLVAICACVLLMYLLFNRIQEADICYIHTYV